jgi:serine/threonine protein kinase/signal transduction histidine kinase
MDSFYDLYQIIDSVSSGHSCDVFIVRKTDSDDKFFLKSFREDYSKGGEVFNSKIKFQREIDMASSLDHPNICKPVDALIKENVCAIVYPFRKGRCLSRLLEEGVVFSEIDAAHIIIQILDALDYLHSRGLIHADINPCNIYIDDEKGVQLLDFGLTLTIDEAQSLPEGRVIGTLPYLSPEQMGFTNHKIDNRTDLYCAAIIMYRLLSGRLPFTIKNSTSLTDLLNATLKREVEPIHIISEVLNSIVFKALKPTPNDRYQTAHGFIADLKYAIQEIKGEQNEVFLIGEKDAVAAISQTKLFVAREKEISILEKSLHSFARKEFFACIIYGQSGVGKTELVNHFWARFRSTEALLLSAKCNRFTPNQPYSIFRTIVLEVAAKLSELEQSKRLKLQAVFDDKLGESSGIICKYFPELRFLFTTIKEYEKVESDKEENRIAHVFSSLLIYLSDIHPAIFFIDDLQWIDKISFSIFKCFLEIRPACLFIACHRTANHHDEDLFVHGTDIRCIIAASYLHILPFTEKELSEFVYSKFGKINNGDQFNYLMHSKTDGNPFDFTEAMRYLISSSLLERQNNGWSFRIDNTSKLPDKFDSVTLILSKTELLSKEDKYFLELSSLIEGKFDADLIEELGNFQKAETNRIIRKLEYFGFIIGHIRGGYSFTHDKIQESILFGIDSSKKLSLYESLAALYLQHSLKNKELIFNAAECLIKSKNISKAITICYDAALYAYEKIAFDVAIRYFKTIQFLSKQLEKDGKELPINLLKADISFGDVLMLTGKNEQALKIFEGLRDKCKLICEEDLLEIIYKIGSIYHNTGEFSNSIKYFKEALSALKVKIPNNNLELILHLVFELILQVVFSPFTKIFAKKKCDHHSKLIVKILNKLSYSLYFHDMVASIYVQLRASNSADKLEDCAEKAEAFSEHAFAIYQMLMKKRAFRYGEKAISISKRISRKDSFAFAQSVNACVSYFAANWDKSRALAQSSINSFNAIGHIPSQILSAEHLWKIGFAQGDFRGADLNIKFTIDLCNQAKEKFFFLVARSVQTLLAYIKNGSINEEELSQIDSVLKEKESFLFHIESGSYLLQLEILQQKISAAYNRAQRLIQLIKSKCLNSEYQVRTFSLLCEILCLELYKKNQKSASELQQLSTKQVKIKLSWGLKILFASCVTFPAYWGSYYLFTAWFFCQSRKHRKANKFFLKSIKCNHTLSMRYEEARSYRDYAIFLEEFRNKPGEARDKYNEAYKLFSWCGAKLEMGRIESKVDPWVIQSCIDAAKKDAQNVEKAAIPKDTTTSSISGGVNQVQVNALYSLATSMSKIDSIDELVGQILKSMIDATGAQHGSLLIDGDKEREKVSLFMDFEGKKLDSAPIAQAITDKVRTTRSPILIRDGSLDRELFANDPQQLRSVLCVPLAKGDQYIGCIYLSNDKVSGLFTDTALKTAQIMAAQALIVLENAWLMDRYKRLNRDLEGKVRDQTADIRQKNDQLHEYNLKLVENERMKNLLTGTLVHDIKNFVMSIQGSLQLLESRVAQDEKNGRFIHMGLTACGDITALASNLMDIQKIEEGKMPVNAEKIETKLICDIIDTFKETATFVQKDIAVIVIPPMQRETFWADLYLLKRVVHNLMSNAGKYVPNGGEVVLTFEENDDEQIMSIFSSGEPIPAEYRDILFDKYSRMGQERSAFSKGIGLFFCKTVMLAHGGRIWLDTDTRGNYFKMAFPR